MMSMDKMVPVHKPALIGFPHPGPVSDTRMIAAVDCRGASSSMINTAFRIGRYMSFLGF
jgi:hypothetical protein